MSRFLPDGTEDSLGLFETRWIHPSTYDIRHLNFSPAGVGPLNCVSRKLLTLASAALSASLRPRWSSTERDDAAYCVTKLFFEG